MFTELRLRCEIELFTTFKELPRSSKLVYTYEHSQQADRFLKLQNGDFVALDAVLTPYIL